jgi:hypothetical protein
MNFDTAGGKVLVLDIKARRHNLQISSNRGLCNSEKLNNHTAAIDFWRVAQTETDSID